jgi:glycerophosphoryl diester phosphodiesterase
MAHRGASRQCRENTIDAFRRARELGADAVELDVRRTSDAVLVVHHDPALDDGRALVHLAYADLPTHVPTLAAALDACDGMWVNVEIKNDPSEVDFDAADHVAVAVAHALTGRGEPANRWLVSSFRRETIDVVTSTAPALATAWLCLDLADVDLAELAAAGHVAVHPWVEMLTAETIDACHRAGLSVNTWTCDDPRQMSELVTWGVDGICTNVPDIARQVVGGGSTNPTASGT